MKRKPVKGEFRFSPLTIPLKTTKKGAAAPFLGFSPGLVLCRGYFKSTKRTTDAYWIDRRGSRNTLRLFQLRLEWQSVCARCARLSLQKGHSFDFHTSNIQRAQTERSVWHVVRSGSPIGRPPEGRLDYGWRNDNAHNVTTSFFCASALFRPQRSFLPYLFCQDRKDMARGAADAASQTAPRLRRIRMQKYDCRRQNYVHPHWVGFFRPGQRRDRRI